MSSPSKAQFRLPRILCRLASLFALASAALLLAFSASASADFTLCSAGSGVGQCIRPVGIAVDHSNGNVYIADMGNNRIDVFGSEGDFIRAFGWGVADGSSKELQTCTSTCFEGIEGTGAGQFAYVESIAVDNDPSSPSYQDVYVAEGNTNHFLNNDRIQKFSPSGEFIWMIGGGVNKVTGTDICTAAFADSCGAGSGGGGKGEFDLFVSVALGPGGEVYVADSVYQGFVNGEGIFGPRIQKFGPSGIFVEQISLGGVGPTLAFAVDSIGDFYVYDRNQKEIHKYNSSGIEVGAHVVESASALATGLSDHLFVGEGGGVDSVVVTEYDQAGSVFRRFGYGSMEGAPSGLAPDPSSPGDVYISETQQDRVRYLTAPPPGPLPCCLAPMVGNTKATLKGGVNPEGKATTYHFDYITDADFLANGNSFSGPSPATSTPATSTPESAPVGSDFTLHNAESQIGCAVPPQAGCLTPGTPYRYRLVTKNADGENSVAGQFKTLPPFEIKATWATEVGTDSAQLHASVNPLGIPTTAYFEYVDDATYQADKGEGHDGFTAATKVPDVEGGQAPLDLGSGEAEKTVSVQLSLAPGTTYHYRVVVADSFVSEAGSEHVLSTSQAPVPSANSCPNASFRIGPAAGLPDCRAYELVSPVDKNGGDIKVLDSNLNYPARLEQSSGDGNRFAYSSVTAFADSVSAPWTSEYLATREEGKGWSTHAISPPRESTSLTQTPAFKFDVQFKSFSPDLSNGWLIQDTDPPLDECAPAGVLNLYRRDNASGAYEALTTNKPTNVGAGGYELELQGLSADGSRAVFRANGKLTPNAATKGLSQLYEHVADPEGGCGELRLVSVLPNGTANTGDASVGTFGGLPGETRGNAVSNAVSADGSRVFWSTETLGVKSLYLRDMDAGKTVSVSASSAQFWNAAIDGSRAIYSVGEELFEFDTEKALAGEAASTLIAKGAQGVVATSEDASRIYFVSTEELAGEGEAGKPNLYLHEAGANSLVATLDGGPIPAGGDLSGDFFHDGFAVGRSNSNSNGVRATADGGQLAFVSAATPSGYDNADAVDGRPDLEVYLYDAANDEVACISCNPSGGRPRGRLFKGSNGESRMVSARMPAAQNQFFTPRALTTDGDHLFFESFEALLARDTNGADDVYEWSRGSSQKECTEQGAELYVPSAGGCLSLISSGQSPTDSELADVSPDGSDVFIRTAASLLPQDPGQIDVYDARINGGLPQPPSQPAACEGEACQGPLAPPNDPTPASVAFNGAGNVASGPARKKAHKKKKQRDKRSQKKRHAKRDNHNRRAQR